MGAHEKLEAVLGWSPRTKVIVTLVIIGLLLAAAGALIYTGYRWAHSNAEAERMAQDDQIAVLTASGEQHLKNLGQLGAENAFLKKQNEAQAEALKQVDTDRERKALADLQKADADRAQKMSEIDADQNFNSQLCATCQDYKKRLGVTLSFCVNRDCGE